MSRSKSDALAELADTMYLRRRVLGLRLVFGLIAVLAFGPLAGWTGACAAFGVYVLLQLTEFVLYAPERTRAARISVPGTLALLTANGLVYGALPMLAAINGGPWGMTCGSLFLAAAVLNTVLTNRRSRAAFVTSMAPHAAFLAAIAVLAWIMSGRPAVGGALGAISCLMVLFSSMLWRSVAAGYALQRRAQVEAERRRREAEAAVEAKSSFIAMVSHELRTPISAILAGAEAIERNPDTAETDRANAALIGEAGRMMSTLLNDLLDLSKMEAGRMKVETIAFDPSVLIHDTAAFWSAQAARKHLALDLDQSGLPTSLAGDPTRLRQILNNLLSNALKFTEQGRITLAVDAAPRAQDWLVRISVRDTGSGMTDEQQERLFTPFEQALASTARTHGGTGLGLTISRELARLMGGDLTVRSKLGEGSTFTLEIGLTEHAGEAPAALPSLARLRVLAVDDHEVNRWAIGLMLEPLEADLTTADCGEAALEILAREPFDVVLMDLQMPGMNGDEACQRLRAEPGPNRSTPVIACTGSDRDEDLDACRAAGMSGLVTKPFDPASLHAALAAATAQGRDKDAAAA